MKYQYIADISKALQKVYWRDNGAVYVTGSEVPDEMVADIAVDVDAVTRLLIQHEWDFRSDNSDRSAAGAKMPPELEQLEMKLDTCRKICSTVATKQTDDAERAAWLKRESFFVWWIHLLVDYYPDARTTVVEREVFKKWKGPSERKTSTAIKKDGGGGGLDKDFAYYVGSNFDVEFVRDSIKKQMDNHSGGVKGGRAAAVVFMDAIEEGMIDANTPMAVFYREFKLSGTCRNFTTQVGKQRKAK